MLSIRTSLIFCHLVKGKELFKKMTTDDNIEIKVSIHAEKNTFILSQTSPGFYVSAVQVF